MINFWLLIKGDKYKEKNYFLKAYVLKLHKCYAE